MFKTKKVLLFAFVALLPSSEWASAAEYNYATLLHTRMKLDSDFNFEAYADSYMRLYRPSVYKQSRNDEFQIRQKRNETVAMMKQAVDQVSFENEYALRTTINVGAYDFKEQTFYVNEAGAAWRWSQSRSYCSDCDLPSKFSIYFGNFDLIRRLPMTETQANDFINRRKDRYGNINRLLYATINFQIVGFKDDKSEFLTEIQSAQFFEDQHRTRLVYEVKKPADAPQITKADDVEQPATPGREETRSYPVTNIFGAF